MTRGSGLLDLGCGNGRDALYFNNEGMIVTALDIVDPRLDNVDFVRYDLQEYKRCFGLDKTFNFVYCRFMIHAVPKEIEKHILRESWNILETEGILCIETRSDKGKIPMDNHYRRLINLDELLNDLAGFNILYNVEQKGLSIYNNDDPVLIRIICRK
jgi:ubiquinone/menaquinone biosynthesis C-methylase UbiE